MTLEEMKKKRTEMGYSYRELSELTGIPLGTVQKIFGGVTSFPRRETILKLQKVLQQEEESCGSQTNYQIPSNSEQILKESSALYGSNTRKEAQAEKKQGEYTMEDYYALPDDQRVELIDGVFYDMSAPSSPHQFIGGSIHSQLLQFRREKKLPCLPMIAPVDVQLDQDDRTMVQPDVMIVCDRSIITFKGIFGAPDFIVEVLSPSTRKKDMSIKMMKYMEAGVREYWMIDAVQKKVIVYDLEHAAIPVIYSFSDPVPVGIWGGACKINLMEVSELLDELFPELQLPGK